MTSSGMYERRQKFHPLRPSAITGSVRLKTEHGLLLTEFCPSSPKGNVLRGKKKSKSEAKNYPLFGFGKSPRPLKSLSF